jgi:Mg2+ and Co2+ transporter CorA
MADMTDAVLPVLKKIQDELAAVRREQQAAKERDVNMGDVIMTLQSEVLGMRKDSLQHLGLTTRHRMSSEVLEKMVEDLAGRVEALEARN